MAEAYNDLLCNRDRTNTLFEGLLGGDGGSISLVRRPAVRRKYMLQWKNAHLIGVLVILGSLAAAFGNWGWDLSTWGW
jgi:hypothetical protein